jgi:hypothetical protein
MKLRVASVSPAPATVDGFARRRKLFGWSQFETSICSKVRALADATRSPRRAQASIRWGTSTLSKLLYLNGPRG